MAVERQQDGSAKGRISGRPLPKGFKGWPFYYNAFRIDLAAACIHCAMWLAPKTMRPLFDCYNKALEEYGRKRLQEETYGVITGVWYLSDADRRYALRLENRILHSIAEEAAAIRNGDRPTFEKPGGLRYQFD
jgi:hypothetical protein